MTLLSPPIIQDRTPAFWNKLVTDAKHAVALVDRRLRGSLGRRHGGLAFVSSPDRVSPSIRITNKNALQIDFPERFFLWTDEAARHMVEDSSYRCALSICRTWPKADPSWIFHQYWNLWVTSHEISHYFCGHLHHLSVREFVELGVANSAGFTADDRLLRESMEVDADVSAARLFFGAIGRQAVQGRWTDLYMTKDSSRLAMQDLGLIFLPLFLLIGRSDPSDSNRRIHPKAFDRMVLLLIFGLAAYREEVGPEADQDRAGFMAGLAKGCELLLHIEGTMLHSCLNSTDFTVHKQVLLAAQMHKKRVIDLPQDWLRGP